MYWFIHSTDPYNRIGKHAIQDVYSWSLENRVKHRFLFSKNPINDIIRIDKVC